MKSWKLWRKTAVALVALIVLTVVSYTMEIHQMESQATALKTESERIFRTLFPDRKKSRQ
ncbi:GspL/Epsl periplasmic domain-containing protein [Vibrio sp. PP-XX7]